MHTCILHTSGLLTMMQCIQLVLHYQNLEHYYTHQQWSEHVVLYTDTLHSTIL